MTRRVPLLVPSRRYGTELLDDPSLHPELVVRTVGDITRANTVFQGARAAIAELESHFAVLGPVATLLDVGTGLGDVPRKAQQAAARRSVSLRTIGLDTSFELARAARAQVSYAVCGSGLALPFADASVDFVLCSQTLHHFRGADAAALLSEMDRVARVAVVVSDLRRSWIAAGGFWAASFPLRFHKITRHDGVVSVLRGFTPDELADTVHDALGIRPRVRKRLGFRVTTSWMPRAARGRRA